MAPCCYAVAAVVIIAIIGGTERQGRPRRLIFGDRRGEERHHPKLPRQSSKFGSALIRPRWRIDGNHRLRSAASLVRGAFE